jgi:hypothetical protein
MLGYKHVQEKNSRIYVPAKVDVASLGQFKTSHVPGQRLSLNVYKLTKACHTTINP